jgi:hypothetical protein
MDLKMNRINRGKYIVNETTIGTNGTSIGTNGTSIRKKVLKFASIMMLFGILASHAFYGVYYLSKLKNEEYLDKQITKTRDTRSIKTNPEFGNATVFVTNLESNNANISSMMSEIFKISFGHNSSVVELERINTTNTGELEFITPHAVNASENLMIEIREKSIIPQYKASISIKDVLNLDSDSNKVKILNIGLYKFQLKILWQEWH